MYPQVTELLTNDLLLIMAATNDRPVLSSEKTPHIDKTAPDSNKNLSLGPRKSLTPRLTSRLTVCRNVTDFELIQK
jgi:hypothetical protein